MQGPPSQTQLPVWDLGVAGSTDADHVISSGEACLLGWKHTLQDFRGQAPLTLPPRAAGRRGAGSVWRGAEYPGLVPETPELVSDNQSSSTSGFPAGTSAEGHGHSPWGPLQQSEPWAVQWSLHHLPPLIQGIQEPWVICSPQVPSRGQAIISGLSF